MTLSPYLPMKEAAPYMGVEQNAAYKAARKNKLPVHQVVFPNRNNRPQKMVLREELLLWLELEAKRFAERVTELQKQREKLWRETYGI